MPDFDTHSFFTSIFAIAQWACIHATDGMPPESWWLAAFVILILGATALIDCFTSTIPDILIFAGMFAVVATQGFLVSWPFAAQCLAIGLVAPIALWGFNQLWYRFFKHDAIGMGDGKWTMLAVACFGIAPALIAWGFGACLAILWIGVLCAMRHKITRVYFAPFLFIGLAAGIYWLRLRA